MTLCPIDSNIWTCYTRYNPRLLPEQGWHEALLENYLPINANGPELIILIN